MTSAIAVARRRWSRVMARTTPRIAGRSSTRPASPISTAREQRVRYRPGDVLLYRHDLWHRGTALQPGALRLAHNITYRAASAEWISVLHVGWAWSAYAKSKFLERLIAAASLEQRAVLGFPQPGSSYWTDETVVAVEARYGAFGMDMGPYRDAIARR